MGRQSREKRERREMEAAGAGARSPGRTGARSDRTESGPPVFGIVVGVVVAVAAIALFAWPTGDDSATADVPEKGFAEVSIEGDSLAAIPGGGQPGLADGDAAVGEPAPVATGEDTEGEPVTIGGEAQPTLAVFAAHWCPHCRDEVPRLVEWYAGDGAALDGVRMVAVATGSSESQVGWPPSQWLAGEDWEWPVLYDDETSAVGDAYGVESYPAFVAIDADGNVAARASGELEQEQVEELLDAARSGAG